jgi:protein phosphatase
MSTTAYDVIPHDRPTPAEIDVFGLTHQGHVREANEDHFLIASLHKTLRTAHSSLPLAELDAIMSDSRGYLFLVADGVGGLEGGDRASGTALGAVARFVTETVRCYYNYDGDEERVLLDHLQHTVLQAHALLREREAGTATTLTMVFVAWPRAYVVHVGDTRCYRLRDGQLELVTTDQTIAQSMVDAGVMTAIEADQTEWKHVLSSALGASEASPATRVIDCARGDVMLLCTDGLTKHVADDELRDALARDQSSEQTCRALVDLALTRGGTDNVTVIVGRLRPR